MEIGIIIALSAVLAAWIGVALFIRRWGPGLLQRVVVCPNRHVPARVTFVREEVLFGGLKITDVAKCSLFPDGPVMCDKKCMG